MIAKKVWYKRFNPLNYLAGKLFLWFWLMIALTVLSLVIIASQIDPGLEDQPIPPYIISQIDSFDDRLHRGRRSGPNDFERLIRSPRVRRTHMILWTKEGGPLKSAKPLPPEFDVEELDIDNPTPKTEIIGGFIVYGPFEISDHHASYRIFAVGRYDPHPMMRFKSLPLWLRLGLPLAISAFLSLFVAMSITNPILSLRNAHRSLAQGNLDTRSNGVALRNDELGQLGQDFDDMADKISQLLAAQKRLLGDVSHELRSPLARMQIALGLAIQPDSKDLERHLLRIELEANRLDDMIGDVLRLSRLESQLQNIELFPLSLKSLLSYLVKDANFEAKGDEKAVTLDAVADANVMGDQALLASAFENVVRNAVKYTEQKTTVAVTLQIDAGQVIVKVRDFGPGVPASALSQLFQPFYRVSDSRQRSSGGTGLGLAIAEKSIRSHGGSIIAHNHQEQGLEVTVKLPLHSG
ncbi:MAG: ATP-binding protein [Psychrosphaera sp.]|nr:ATP-binding protein [Psychrosphaera sp.]